MTQYLKVFLIIPSSKKEFSMENKKGFKRKASSIIAKLTFSQIEIVFLYIAGTGILFSMCLTTSDVFGRYALRKPIIGTVEITELLLVIIIYFAVANTEMSGTHISMSAIPEMLKRKEKMKLYHAIEIFNFVFPLFIFILACGLFILSSYNAYVSNEASFGPLYIRYWPLKLIIAIGFGSLCIRLTLKIIGHIKELTK